MAASLQPTSSKTTILDLNDDCLKEVFAHMDLDTLANVADVCTRFKQDTMDAARKAIKKISVCVWELWIGGKPSVNVCPILRNFGEFVEEIEVLRWVGHNVEKRFIQYLSLYCVGESIELRWGSLRITDEIAILMRPLLGRVQKLRFSGCRLDKVFLRNLPLWSAGLQESEYGASKPVNDHKKQFNHLRQSNLKSISFRSVSDIENAHIGEFLQLNPQLKEIELFSCESLDNCVLESIARNASTIEKLVFVIMRKREPSNRDHIKSFLQLHELKSLTLGVNGEDSFIQSVVHEIASINACLDYLDLHYIDLRHNPHQFIEGISKLQQLKTLRLRHVKHFTAAHLIEICKHAKELSDMCFEHIDMILTKDDLLEIVKNAKKLQEFKWSANFVSNATPSNIDGDTFLKLAKLVDQRNEKTNLCVYLPSRFFTLKIPADVLTVVNNLKMESR